MNGLCKHIPLKTFNILSPRWRDRRVLLAAYKVQENNKILFTGKDGASMGDQPYYISGKEVKKHKKESNGTISCYSVPLDKLELLQISERCEHAD